MTILDVALHWLSLGIATIPLRFYTKKPDPTALRLTGDVEAGRAVWNRYQAILPTPEQLKLWFTGPRRNIGLVTGWGGLVVLDFDTMEAWNDYLGIISQWALSRVAGSYKVLTSRGVHLYLFVEEQVPNGHCGVIDIKSAGGYVLVPPSVHPSGKTYEAVDNQAPIIRVERLADVFPFEVNREIENAPLPTEQPLYTIADDPWEAASHVAVSQGRLVDTIRSAKRIEDLFPNAEKSGSHYLVDWCPFHPDQANGHSKSFWIDTAKQICGCWAGCNGARPWDIINLYSRLRGISNVEAICELGR